MRKWTTADRRLFELFAELLEYPGPAIAEIAWECEDLLALEHPEAAALMQQFRRFVDKVPVGRLQELYTVTFDLDTACYPYLGHHLFGESYKRSVFLLGLKERYQSVGLAYGNELPDHMAIVLRFLAVADDEAVAEDLVQEALLPALHRMVREKNGQKDGGGHESRPGRNPYLLVLRALESVVSSQSPVVSTR